MQQQMSTLICVHLCVGHPGGALQKTSGAAVRSLMDDLISENRFGALSSVPSKSLQPRTGRHDLLALSFSAENNPVTLAA